VNTLISTTESVFGHLLANQPIPNTDKAVKKLLKEHGVLVEFMFLNGLKFIRNPQKLLSVDYVILDIYILIGSDDSEALNKILQDYYEYEPQPDDESADELSFDKAKGRLIPVAGYQLYIELVMALGFPKEHILFCSNHAEEQKDIQAVFKQAKIELPLLLSKDDKAEVQAWVKERR